MAGFKVKHYRIRVDRSRWNLSQPFSAVFLSDLHNRTYGYNNEVLVRAIAKESPEVIFIAGDMVTAGKTAEIDQAILLIQELSKRYPIFYAPGNHESRIKRNKNRYRETYVDYCEFLNYSGIHLLENTSELYIFHRFPIMIHGLELTGKYFAKGFPVKLLREEIDEMIGKPDEEAFNLLLAHHPVYFNAYADWGADLVLSGHLHGGIVRLPFLGGVISPQIRLFPRYDRGLFKKKHHQMIVSAGLGSHTIPIRINNPPQMIVIEFY